MQHQTAPRIDMIPKMKKVPGWPSNLLSIIGCIVRVSRNTVPYPAVPTNPSVMSGAISLQ